MKIYLPGDGTWVTWVLIVLLIVWRVVVPIVFARKASGKGYSYYLFALLGIFVSPLLCILLAFLLPDKGEQERMRAQITDLEAELEELRGNQAVSRAGDEIGI